MPNLPTDWTPEPIRPWRIKVTYWPNWAFGVRVRHDNGKAIPFTPGALARRWCDWMIEVDCGPWMVTLEHWRQET